ncbi:MAG TPA: AsmA family protein [Rhodanobacteraceae bacterium]|nr:AsmA family protein [Rhodanobacteraceae bacterium]
MPGSAPSSRHLLRWIAIGVLVVLAALAVALAIYVHSLLQPQRFTSLIENDLAAVGLRLEMRAPAEPTLFPRPAVQLKGFTLTAIGSDTPILQAAGATIVVPWRALLHGEVAIERIDVDAPRLDLGELQSLFARLPHRAGGGAPRLPTIATGIRMSHGTLTRNGSPLLFDFGLQTGALAPGQAFGLDASGRSAAGRQFAVHVDTVPSAPRDGAIDFDPLRIHFTADPGPALLLDGQGTWRGGEDLALQLEGTLQHRMPAPAASGATAAGATSAPGTAAARTDRAVSDEVAIELQPARGDRPLTVALKLDGNDAHVDMRLRPTEFGAWWNRLLAGAPGQPPAPLPFEGAAQVRELDLGWLKAKGLRMEATPGVASASSASATPAPASTGAAEH